MKIVLVRVKIDVDEEVGEVERELDLETYGFLGMPRQKLA